MSKQEDDPDEFIRQVGSEVINDTRFKTSRHRTKFEVKKLEDAENPERVLRRCIERSIEQGMHECKKAIGFPDKFGIRLFSPMLKYDMWFPIGKLNPNTVDSMLNRFHQIDMSAEPCSILGAPFTVEVTTVCEEELMRLYGHQRGYMPGRGRKRLRKSDDNNIEYAYHDDGLIRISNRNDGFCLFHACEMARLDKVERDRKRFQRYRESYAHQLENVQILMEAVGAPDNLPFYDATVWLGRIQEYYDQQYPGQFCFYVFEKYGQYKPKMKTGDKHNLHPLCLYYDNEHYDTIPKITRFFASVESYCFACESPFKDIHKHRLKCELLCIMCRGNYIYNNFKCLTSYMLVNLHNFIS